MRTFYLVLITLLTVLNANTTQAGQCIPQTISPEYIEKTDLIFEGHLSDNVDENPSVPSTEETLIDNFTITKLWKGDAKKEITIKQGIYHGRSFSRGKKYLIFAGKSSDAIYSTSGCELIVEFSDEAPIEITFLETYFKQEEKE